MCNDSSTPCYQPFPNIARNLFKTGRRDCYPRYENKPFLGYLAKEIESHPDKNGNGEKTTKYFKDNFNMIPREGLALMGAHTVGAFSTFQEHVDYAWVRAKPASNKRNQVFNNEYYKTLMGQPAKTKSEWCVGTMDGKGPKHEWLVRALLFEYMWPQKETWNKRPRRLLWNHLVTRSPVCSSAEEDKLGDGGKFWNDVKCNQKEGCKRSNYGKEESRGSKTAFYDYCCDQKRAGCGMEGKEKCDEDCNRPVQDRIRHLSSDVGFYLKWKVDANGYPTEKYCDAFSPQKNSVLGNRDWMWLYHFDSSKTSAFEKDKNDPKKISKDRQRILDGGEEGRTANCPKQVNESISI